ncbi:sterol-binding protein [Anoxybacteroides amylolyticum]|nr:sterol-binding protein [Anoxybacillus amylolyticus]
MSMDELVKQFVERVNALKHLLPILPEEALYVCFQCEEEEMIFCLSKQGMYRTSEVDEQKAVTVCGTKEALKSLFYGELKLQQQLRLKEIAVFGSFRHILLLESLFHLAKPYRHAS